MMSNAETLADFDWLTFRQALESLPMQRKLLCLRRLADATLEIHMADCPVLQGNYIRILNYVNGLVSTYPSEIQALPEHIQRSDLQLLSSVIGSMGKCDRCPKYFLSDTNERTCRRCQSRSN